MRRVRLTDRYLTGTRLRLRAAVELDGGTAVERKLTQKVPGPLGGPGLITTIYLSAEEHDVLAQLPAEQLAKVRSSHPPFGVDVFDNQLAGLVLAEVEFDTEEELTAFEPPQFALAEVTMDPRFTGGHLVTTSREELRIALREFGLSIAP